MLPSTALNMNREAIREIALRHHVSNISVFGSAMRGDDKEGSDLDLLVEPTSMTSLWDISAIRLEIGDLLGIDVDVLTPNALPEKFRNQVMAEAVPV